MAKDLSQDSIARLSQDYHKASQDYHSLSNCCCERCCERCCESCCERLSLDC